MQDIKKALDEQIRQLEYELTTELPAEIKKAVALGDLSEPNSARSSSTPASVS